jgi:hypothetical protein
VREDSLKDNDILGLIMLLDHARDRGSKGYRIITSTSKTSINLFVVYRNSSQGGMRSRSIGPIHKVAIIILWFRSLRPSRDVTTLPWPLDLLYPF